MNDEAKPSAVAQFAEAMKAMNEPLAAWARKCQQGFGALTEAPRRPVTGQSDTANLPKLED